MQKLQVGPVQIEALAAGIVISDDSQSNSCKILVPFKNIHEIIEFFTYHAEADKANQRQSFRLALDPGEISGFITTSSQKVAASPLDISLGGALLKIETGHRVPFERGETGVVHLDLDGKIAELQSEVVRVAMDQFAVRFIDCETDGDLTPTPELMQLYSEIQRRWLAKRIKK